MTTATTQGTYRSTVIGDWLDNRHDGESWPRFRRRRQIEGLEYRAWRHELAAARLRRLARRLRETAA